jgi:hypothetical protein
MAEDLDAAVDPDVAQARLLLASLWESVGDTSRRIEVAEAQVRRMTPRTGQHTQYRQHAEALRRELYETHRLIDGIHRRFPHSAKAVGADGTV